MLSQFLMSLQTVERATTPEEREGIYRLRYDVYINELEKGFLPNIDHERQWVKDPEDEDPSMGLFYTGEPGNPSGTIRVDIYQPGEVPEEVAKRFSLQLFPWLKNEPIAEAGRLIINPKHRGAFILPALARKIYEFAVFEKYAYHGFLYCAPGLVRAYARLGFRPYAGDLVFNSDGVRVPMILLASDKKFFKEAGSPLLPLVKKYFGPGMATPIDLSLYKNLLGDDAARYKLNPEEICQQMEEEFLQSQSAHPMLLKGLPDSVVKELSSKGFIIEVPAGQVVIRQGLHEKEMFLILDGVFEVFKKDKIIAIRNPGDIFGELAFFLDSGKRTASIKSLSNGRILVLRRNFLQELMDTQPKLAAQLLLNINIITAQRMSRMME